MVAPWGSVPEDPQHTVCFSACARLMPACLHALAWLLLQAYAVNSNFENADLTNAVVDRVVFDGANLKWVAARERVAVAAVAAAAAKAPFAGGSPNRAG